MGESILDLLGRQEDGVSSIWNPAVVGSREKGCGEGGRGQKTQEQAAEAGQGGGPGGNHQVQDREGEGLQGVRGPEGRKRQRHPEPDCQGHQPEDHCHDGRSGQQQGSGHPTTAPKSTQRTARTARKLPQRWRLKTDPIFERLLYPASLITYEQKCKNNVTFFPLKRLLFLYLKRTCSFPNILID